MLVKPDAALGADGKFAGAAWLVAEVLNKLRPIEGVGGDDGVKALFEKSKLDLTKLLPPDSASEAGASELLAAAGLTFVAPELGAAAAAAAAKAEAEAAKAKLGALEEYLASGVLKPPSNSDDPSAEEI